MSIIDFYAKGIDDSIAADLRKPPPPEGESFSAWSAIKAGAKGPIAGGLESTGTALDAASNFGTVLSATGGSVGGMFALPSDTEREAEKKARERMLAGQTGDVSLGGELRAKADTFAPDPETAHTADRVIFGLTKGVSKAVVDIGTLGPVGGAVALAVDEGNTEAQRLRAKGVDDVTAAKVGAVTGVAAGAGVALPVVGKSAAQTVALIGAGGPGLFVAQETLARNILRKAGREDEARARDPTDPLGLAISLAGPVVGAAFNARSQARAKSLADVVQEIESAGRRYGKDGQLLTSPKGAQGEMQVMPGTSRDPGFGVTPARDGSPDELARVGRDYLSAMAQRYGDTDKAMAAYNAGPGAVDAAVKTHGDAWLKHLPDETQKYVAKGRDKLGDAAATEAAADPQSVAAARVKVSEFELQRSLPDVPTARADMLRASDMLGAGEMPRVEAVHPTAMPEFRDWFGASRAVDEQGAPIALVKGADGDFRPATADSQGVVYLKAEQPATAMEVAIIRAAIGKSASDADVQAALQSRGFDAFHDKTTNTWRPFEAKQVREQQVDQMPERAPQLDKPSSTPVVSRARAQSAGRLTSAMDRAVAEVETMRASGATAADHLATRDLPPEVHNLVVGLSEAGADPRLVEALRRSVATEAAKPAKSAADATADAVDSWRSMTDQQMSGRPTEGAIGTMARPIETLLAERPDMKVRLPESEETVTVAEAMTRARAEAEFEAGEAELIRAAVECALGG